MATKADSTLDVAAIRTALGEIDAETIPDSVIDQKLSAAHLVVRERLVDSDADTDLADLSQDLYDHLVTQEAAYRAFTAAPLEKQRQALDLSTTWDVETYIEALTTAVSDAWELVGETAGGTSAAFVDTTAGVFDQTDSKQ